MSVRRSALVTGAIRASVEALPNDWRPMALR